MTAATVTITDDDTAAVTPNDGRALGQRGGLRDGDSGFGDGHGGRRRDSVDGGGAVGGSGDALGERGGDHDHGHSEVE